MNYHSSCSNKIHQYLEQLTYVFVQNVIYVVLLNDIEYKCYHWLNYWIFL